MARLRLLCVAVLLTLASPLSPPPAQAKAPALYVKDIRVVVDRNGFAAVHGLVVCNFPHDRRRPDFQETGGLLRQGRSSSISLGDFTGCGLDIGLDPFPGGDDDTRYHVGRARLEGAGVHLCHDTSQTPPCYDWGFTGSVTISRMPVLADPTLRLVRFTRQRTASGSYRVRASLAWKTAFRGGYPTTICVNDVSGGDHHACVGGINPDTRRYTTSSALLGELPKRTKLEYVVIVSPPFSRPQLTNGIAVRV